MNENIVRLFHIKELNVKTKLIYILCLHVKFLNLQCIHNEGTKFYGTAVNIDLLKNSKNTSRFIIDFPFFQNILHEVLCNIISCSFKWQLHIFLIFKFLIQFLKCYDKYIGSSDKGVPKTLTVNAEDYIIIKR